MEVEDWKACWTEGRRRGQSRKYGIQGDGFEVRPLIRSWKDAQKQRFRVESEARELLAWSELLTSKMRGPRVQQ